MKQVRLKIPKKPEFPYVPEKPLETIEINERVQIGRFHCSDSNTVYEIENAIKGMLEAHNLPCDTKVMLEGDVDDYQGYNDVVVIAYQKKTVKNSWYAQTMKAYKEAVKRHENYNKIYPGLLATYEREKAEYDEALKKVQESQRKKEILALEKRLKELQKKQS